MGTARCKEKVCEECRILAFLIGKLKAENEELKKQIVHKDEALAFHQKLGVHIGFNGVLYKEDLWSE